MDFSTMASKLNDELYYTLEDFSADFQLICYNAMIYNKSNTVYYKSAETLRQKGMQLLEAESERFRSLNIKNMDDSMSIEVLDHYLVPYPWSVEKNENMEQRISSKMNCLVDDVPFEEEVNILEE